MIAAAAVCSAACSVPHRDADPTLVVASSQYGSIVTDSAGRSVYLYVDDSTDPPRSTCTGGCVADWPIVPATTRLSSGPGLSAKLGVLVRPGGARQLTLAGNPLYYFAGDQRPGDTRGEGIGGVWFLLEPSGEALTWSEPAFGQAFPTILTTLGTHSSSLGTVVTDPEGQTLYAYTLDPRGGSACNASWCVDDWQPLLTEGPPTPASSISGQIGTVRRDDGGTQVALDGHPLYAWTGDLVPGDVRGEGIGGTWFAVSPSGHLVPDPS